MSSETQEDTEPNESDIKDLFYNVLSTTWNDFYDWEEEDCLRTLASLAAPEVAQAILPPELSDLEETNADLYGLSLGDDTPPGEVVIDVSMPITPYPLYESGPLASRGVMNGDDPEYMSFLSYADDPNFRADKYMEDHHYRFAWQWKIADPDCEHLRLSCAQFLRSAHFSGGDSVPSDSQTSARLPSTREANQQA